MMPSLFGSNAVANSILGALLLARHGNGVPSQMVPKTAGVIELTSFIFDNFVGIPRNNPGYRVLARIDNALPDNPSTTSWRLLAQQAQTVPKFFMVEVPVAQYGDKRNDDVRERLDLKFDDFPAIYLYSEEHPEGLRYGGVNHTLRYLNVATWGMPEMCLWLRSNGVAINLKGTIQALDDLARAFVKDFQVSHLGDQHFQSASQIVSESFAKHEEAPVYVRYMQKISERGIGFIDAEYLRLKKLSRKMKVPANKKAEMKRKMEILKVFNSSRPEAPELPADEEINPLGPGTDPKFARAFYQEVKVKAEHR
eukprot:gnl/TRDRNA2_/TRDRNA2_54434_c0_seq1.p1 gnl/TRDRNA2_/TRDRNA2_54434_c0~~gnl/TRDRNA2_/TRDRNA2_54434_c0_seq1.p1  ORF type:complete len:310 (-),score=49.06 gnl/TRDRNA2_/TRDRNA2_54434_c0_seq1:70-999(-)